MTRLFALCLWTSVSLASGRLAFSERSYDSPSPALLQRRNADDIESNLRAPLLAPQHALSSSAQDMQAAAHPDLRVLWQFLERPEVRVFFRAGKDSSSVLPAIKWKPDIVKQACPSARESRVSIRIACPIERTQSHSTIDQAPRPSVCTVNLHRMQAVGENAARAAASAYRVTAVHLHAALAELQRRGERYCAHLTNLGMRYHDLLVWTVITTLLSLSLMMFIFIMSGYAHPWPSIGPDPVRLSHRANAGLNSESSAHFSPLAGPRGFRSG